MISESIVLCRNFNLYRYRAVVLNKRNGDKRIRLHGYFQGAKVKRNPEDWDWGNQDGKPVNYKNEQNYFMEINI